MYKLNFTFSHKHIVVLFNKLLLIFMFLCEQVYKSFSAITKRHTKDKQHITAT